jgi:hypothetical protein
MVRIFKKTGIAVLGLSAALLSGSAFAVMVTVAGSNVSFTYDTALLGLYGTPTVSGDSLIFTPTSFFAESTNGEGFALTNATLNIGITANSGYQFSSISLTERGDYFLVGSDAEVGVTGQIRVFDQDDPINNEVTDNIAATAPFNVVSTLSNITTTNWTANAGVTIPGTGWGGNDGIVDGVNLTIENLLYASTTTLGSAAFIEKKFAGSTVIISAVPEAETYAMMLAGLGLVGFMARRRRLASA